MSAAVSLLVPGARVSDVGGFGPYPITVACPAPGGPAGAWFVAFRTPRGWGHHAHVRAGSGGLEVVDAAGRARALVVLPPLHTAPASVQTAPDPAHIPASAAHCQVADLPLFADC